MQISRKNGFTLIEILIATVFVFLLFVVMYATFFSVSNTINKIQRNMNTSEIMFRFFNRFNREVKCMIREEGVERSFDSKAITFLTMTEGLPYPVNITYTVEWTPEELDKLLRKQENLLNGYSFTFPVISNCESIKFLFYSDGMWREYTETPEKIVAIGIEIQREGEEFFFPVRIYGEMDESEKQ